MKYVITIVIFIAMQSATPCSAQTADSARPETIWRSSCGYCHGAGVAPEIRGMRLPAETLQKIVRGGMPGMPSFHPSEMTNDDIARLAVWIAQTHPPAPASGPALPKSK